MWFETRRTEAGNVAVVKADGPALLDTNSALDLLMSALHDAGTKDIAIAKELVAEDFFDLRSGLAGEVLQKFINYGGRIAIYGDYSMYGSKALRDFIRESNKGRDAFFVTTLEEAVGRLSERA